MRITAKRLLVVTFITLALSGASYAMDDNNNNNKETKDSQSLEELYTLAASKFSSPHELGLFKNIAQLDLSQCGLKEITGDICSMRHLSKLDLSNNSIGSLPKSMGNLTKLKKINLSHNTFSKFPQALLKLKKIKHIGLACNALQSLPDNLYTMSSLSSLDVSNNALTLLPQQLYKMSNLKKMNVMYNPCTQINQKKKPCTLSMARYRLAGKKCIDHAHKLLSLLNKTSKIATTKMHKTLKQVFKKVKDKEGASFLAQVPNALLKNEKFRQALKQSAASKGRKKNEKIVTACKKLQESLKYYEWIQAHVYLLDPLMPLDQKDMQRLLWKEIDENHTASLATKPA